jgi:hypothetical protein
MKANQAIMAANLREMSEKSTACQQHLNEEMRADQELLTEEMLAITKG